MEPGSWSLSLNDILSIAGVALVELGISGEKDGKNLALNFDLVYDQSINVITLLENCN